MTSYSDLTKAELIERLQKLEAANRISDDSATLTQHLALRGFAPAGDFEAVTRNQADGKADVYARYVGEV